MIFILLSVVCACTFRSAFGDPCVTYTFLTNEKRSALYTSTAEEPNICDQDIDESAWYRFNVLPPQRIHDECVQPLRCGTDEPIWLNGDHPTANDPGPKTVTVCSPNENDCCGGWESTILVKYCPADETGGDPFYVYRLKRVPNCDMAYCAGNSIVCPAGSTWNPVREKCTEVCPNITTPILEGPFIERKFLVRQENQEYDDFHFECVIRWSDLDEGPKKGGEQFQVVFTFDGLEVEEVPPKITDGSNLRVKLLSKELNGQVGKTVGCQVWSQWMRLERFRSEYYVSDRTYFVGIRYSIGKPEGPFESPRIEIDERSPSLTLYFQSTVPISCPVINKRTSCKITISTADISPDDGFGISNCNMVFSGLEKNNKPRTQKVKALPTPGMIQRTSVIRFREISTNPEFFWHNYKLPDIPIFIMDSSVTGSCSSSGDPHIMTFDKRYYHAFMEGDYLFARSTSSRHFEVHVRHHKCWAVTCNCAVAVREGNNVLGVNACQGPNFTPTPIVYLEDKHVPGATITNVGNVYTITMPSGAYVRMDWYGLHSSITLYLNSEDYGKVVGLCGTFNGNAGDDTIPKGGVQADTSDVPVLFSESYKLDDKESFINGHVYAIDCLEIEDQVPNICSCRDKQVVTCRAPDVKTKTFATQFTQHCKKKHPNAVEPSLRLRRSIGSNETLADDDYDEDDDDEEEENDDGESMLITENDIPVPVVDENHGRNVTLQWPTPGGINETEAERQCRTKMEASPVYAACRDQISDRMSSLVASCVTDVQVSDNVDQAVSYILSDFQTECVQKLESSVVSNDQQGQSTPSPVKQLLEEIVSNICPAQCNGNGVCNNGTCNCNNGFAGVDCSINSRNAPTLTTFRKDAICDGRTTFCSETSIFASNIFWSEKLVCRIKEVDQSQNFMFGGSLMSSREVVCRLPTVPRFTNESSSADVHAKKTEVGPAPFYRWDIALTNDGDLYSNSLQLTVFDSKCQECRSDGSCVQKEETCVIGGRCFVSGEASFANPCEKCVPSKSRHKWTPDKDGCITASSPTWIRCSAKLLTVVAAFTIGFFTC